MSTESPPRVQTPDPAADSSRLRRWPLDPLIVGCAAVLIAFPLAATVAASKQPIARPSVSAAPLSATQTGPRVRDVPVFTPGGATAATVARGTVLTNVGAMHEALREAMDELFDSRQRAELERLLADDRAALTSALPPYPFRIPQLEIVLDAALPAVLDARQARAANDLGALLVLAAARFGSNESIDNRLVTAAPLAFAILDRARTGGACLPQLNLAFLLSTHERPLDHATAAEFGKAEQSCPGDPTPVWLLGQFQSQRLVSSSPYDPEPPLSSKAQIRRALETFHRLERRLPGSSAGWSGEADAELRAAYQLVERQPFSARSRFRRALTLYRKARRLDPDPALAAGEARAYAGLRLYGAAIRAQLGALTREPRPAPVEAQLVEYLERDGRFAEAAAAAARLAGAGSASFPRGPALLMRLPAERDPAVEEAQEPLSLGSDRLLAVSLDVAPIPPLPFTDGVVLDLSFLPSFRQVDGVTGYDRWCPGWLQRRDLVLAGRAEEALAGLPKRFVDIRPGRDGFECPADGALAVPVLAGVAELETGDRAAAVERLSNADFDTDGRRPIGLLQDARQNMWRFAGRLDNARIAAEEWTRQVPTSSTAFDRAGEVAFLAKDYERAARLFGVSSRLARSAAGTWSSSEAEALLKRGTALELAGRYDEALEALAESDEVASRAFGLAREDEDAERAAYLSYNARLQAGDTHLRARRYAAALDQYEAARERERDKASIAPGEPLRRPEVLDNNQALVELRLGNPKAALASARRALQADPLNPIFLQNLGLVLHRLDLDEPAAAAYRAALDSDPTLFPAWNDLGVVLARQGRLTDAATAFRRAVGVRAEYALAWFNLGVALERMGLRHALASEGAFGRAFREDPELRGSERTFVADDATYFTTLDLSKPLPAKWQFAATQERTPVAVAGLALALLFGLQFGRTALPPGIGGDAKRWLELGLDALKRLPSAFTSTAAGIAVAATVAVFLLPVLRSGDASLTSALLLGLGLLLLVVVVVRSRILVARRAGVILRQRGWPPGIAVGLGAAAAGLGWAPLPVVETDRPAPLVHWVGPISTGIAALVLLSLGVGLEAPTTKALGTAALVMTASLLTPIEPLDGGFVAKGPAGLAAGLALLGAAVFLLLGLA